MPEPLSDNPKFDALRNALYHSARAAFLGRVNRAISFLIVILGASVMAKLGNLISNGSTIIEFLLTASATLQLVFDIGGISLRHEFLQKQYYALLGEMETDAAIDPEFSKKWSAKLILIAAEELPQMRALDAVCYNKALDAMYDSEQFRNEFKQKIPLRFYYTRNFLAHPNQEFHTALR